MAEIYRPAYTETDPETGKRVKRKSSRWHVRYYLPDGTRKRVKGYTDKKATEALAANLERRAAREAEGIIDATDAHAKRPLAEHAEDYRRYLAAKGNTARHVVKTVARLLRCLDRCRFVKTGDVQPSRVVEFLGELRAEGKGIATANYYLVAVKGFTRWLWKDKRILADPLAGMSKLAGAEADVRHGRRDFAPDELARLLDAARQSGETFRDLTGADRFALYLFRAGILRGHRGK